jgi:hypothetical protein
MVLSGERDGPVGHLPDAEPLIVSRLLSNWKFAPRGLHSKNGKRQLCRVLHMLMTGTYHGT